MYDKLEPWDIENEEVAFDTRIFQLLKRRTRSKLRPEIAGEFYALRCPRWVNTIALTPYQEVVLIEQYRHGLDDMTLEIPGGMVDGNESYEVAGLRELEEETGFVGEGAKLLGKVAPNPANQEIWCGHVLLENVTATGQTQPDLHEEIRVELVPLNQIRKYIMEGKISHGLVINAFYFLEQDPKYRNLMD